MKKLILTLAIIATVTFGYAAGEGNSEKKAKSTEPVEKAEAAKVQTISLSGKVIDFSSGEALTGVEVTIEGSSKKSYTDFDGNFKFDNLTPGEYNIIASFISYNKSYIEKYDVEKSNDNISIKLQSSL
jgi:hypothetical protein